MQSVAVRSEFLPQGTPASYRYENERGERFYVLAFDYFKTLIRSKVKSYNNGYYRQAELKSAIEWISGKRLPAYVAKNPNLYILSSRCEDALAVLLVNVSLDVIYDPVAELDGEYSSIRFLGCDGRLHGDHVYLSDISPYGICAFEVRK